MTNSLILVIDDDRVILDLLKVTLERAGYTVLQAIDGRSGLDIFHKEAPALVIIDIAMPGIDGYEVVESIRKSANGDSPAIIILTAHQQRVMESYAEEVGANRYLTKPIAPNELLEHVAELLPGVLGDG